VAAHGGNLPAQPSALPPRRVREQRSDAGPRALTAAWGLPLVVACCWLGGWILAAGCAVLAVVGLREFQRLGRTFGVAPEARWEGMGGALVLLAAARVSPGAFQAALPLALAAVLAGGIVRAAGARAPDLRAAALTTAWTVLGVLYIPWLLGFSLLLRGAGPGATARTLGLFGLVWLADVAAYAVGSRYGLHRLARPISPGKSVEGALAGVVAAAAGGAAASGLLHVPLAAGALCGALVAGAGLVGDLWESMLKRAADVKDSGAAVPGHGGVLDRFDSVLLAAPAAYLLLARVPWGSLHLLR
jgi:phosphatidate cytidylyltransferase